MLCSGAGLDSDPDIAWSQPKQIASPYTGSHGQPADPATLHLAKMLVYRMQQSGSPVADVHIGNRCQGTVNGVDRRHLFADIADTIDDDVSLITDTDVDGERGIGDGHFDRIHHSVKQSSFPTGNGFPGHRLSSVNHNAGQHSGSKYNRTVTSRCCPQGNSYDTLRLSPGNVECLFGSDNELPVTPTCNHGKVLTSGSCRCGRYDRQSSCEVNAHADCHFGHSSVDVSRCSGGVSWSTRAGPYGDPVHETDCDTGEFRAHMDLARMDADGQRCDTFIDGSEGRQIVTCTEPSSGLPLPSDRFAPVTPRPSCSDVHTSAHTLNRLSDAGTFEQRCQNDAYSQSRSMSLIGIEGMDLVESVNAIGQQSGGGTNNGQAARHPEESNVGNEECDDGNTTSRVVAGIACQDAALKFRYAVYKFTFYSVRFPLFAICQHVLFPYK